MKPTQMDRLATLQKGHAKLQRGETVLPNRHEVEMRMVAKTVKYVRKAERLEVTND